MYNIYDAVPNLNGLVSMCILDIDIGSQKSLFPMRNEVFDCVFSNTVD